MTTYQIETERCLLSPLTTADAGVLHALWIRPEVRRFLWDDQVIPAEQTVDVIQENIRLFKEYGFGLWGVWLKAAGDFLGFGGYWYFRDPPELELIIGIAPEHWGQGLAPEVGTALLRFAFERLNFTEVHASTDAPNEASVRVMEKIGMRFERRAVASGLDTLFYQLSRTRWQVADVPYFLQEVNLPEVSPARE